MLPYAIDHALGSFIDPRAAAFFHAMARPIPSDFLVFNFPELFDTQRPELIPFTQCTTAAEPATSTPIAEAFEQLEKLFPRSVFEFDPFEQRASYYNKVQWYTYAKRY